MTPHLGNTFLLHSSQQLPPSQSQTLEGLVVLTQAKARDSPCALLPEPQRHKDNVRCGALGA